MYCHKKTIGTHKIVMRHRNIPLNTIPTTEKELPFIIYPNFDIEAVNRAFMDQKNSKHKDIMGCRNKAHRSITTGTIAPTDHSS